MWTPALENLPGELAETVTKNWEQQKPGAGGWDNITPKQVLPTLWRTTQTCLLESWHSCWMTRSSHTGLSQRGAPPWPPSAARRCPWTLMDRCWMCLPCSRALPWTPLSTGHGRRLHSLPEKVTQSKGMCSCVIQTNPVSSSHHRPRRAGRDLQCSPQPRQPFPSHPSKEAPPRPSEPAAEEEPHLDVPGAISVPRDGSLSWHQPHLVTRHSPPLTLLCPAGDRCSEPSSTAPLASGTQSPCP